MMGTFVFLTLRVVHVLFAAVWIGATVFTSFLLMPAVNAAGPAGGQVMAGLNRKGIVPFFASLGGITTLTGIYLYWRFTGGFDPAVSRSHAGMAFGMGGVAGIVAVIIGGAVVGRSSKRIVEVMEQASKTSEGPQKVALMQEAGVLRQRLETFGTVVLVCQLIALVLMAVGHYI
jgi:hypothetical protein